MLQKISKIWLLAYENDNDAFIPEMWANESLAILEENMVAGNLIHRDFSDEIANYGDVVNTRKPAEFTAKRKTDSDSVTIQDASSANIPVALNQWIHVSFMIKDGERSKSFKDLVKFYVQPAMLANARLVDQIILGQAYRFRNSSYGGFLKTASVEADLLALRESMNINKVPVENRRLIVTPKTETDLLSISNFIQAQTVGDDGTAMREARVGRKYGFDVFMCQNTPMTNTTNTQVTGAINSASGHPAGTTSLTVDGLSAAITAGTWFTVAGDMTPQQVVSTTGGATPTAIVCTPGLRRAVVDNAVVTLYTPGAVNNASGYSAGYVKEITVDGFSVAPQVGQGITFGTDTNVYSVVQVNGVIGITLDRPLVTAIADNDKVNIFPAGSYNFGFTRNALSLVSRPLAAPSSGTGALSATANYNGLGMRATITYNGEKQGHLVTLDALLGVAVLDSALGGVMFGKNS
jgi:hypothetical protein